MAKFSFSIKFCVGSTYGSPNKMKSKRFAPQAFVGNGVLTIRCLDLVRGYPPTHSNKLEQACQKGSLKWNHRRVVKSLVAEIAEIAKHTKLSAPEALKKKTGGRRCFPAGVVNPPPAPEGRGHGVPNHPAKFQKFKAMICSSLRPGLKSPPYSPSRRPAHSVGQAHLRPAFFCFLTFFQSRTRCFIE